MTEVYLSAAEIPGGTDSPDWQAIHGKLLMAAIELQLGAVPPGEMTPWHREAVRLIKAQRPPFGAYRRTVLTPETPKDPGQPSSPEGPEG